MKPASFRFVRRYDTAIPAETAVEAARICGFKARDITKEQILLSASLNVWSFGEQIIVSLSEIDQAQLIDISSKCVLPTQIIDWGKNERNVRRLFAAIDLMLGGSPRFVLCPLCRKCGYLLVDGSMPCSECGQVFRFGETDRPDPGLLAGALRISLLIAGIEFGLGMCAALLSWRLPFIRIILIAIFFLLFVNTSVILAIFFLHRIIRPFIAESGTVHLAE
ncbi:MAG: hypothetical protein HY287_01010 [Planctomycetes bacterium]|nr:hypothetical protein [Planctomycetota bacterium]